MLKEDFLVKEKDEIKNEVLNQNKSQIGISEEIGEL